MRRTALWALALAMTCAPQLAEAADAGKGRALAEEHCSRCHVVGDFNPGGGISSTPSFQMLVKRRPDYKDRFRTFYARRPHPVFISVEGIGRPLDYLPPNAHPIEITSEDVEHIGAFVETLKPKKTSRTRTR